MDYRLSAEEIVCVKRLAERFAQGKEWVGHKLPQNARGVVNPHDVADPLELSADKREAILGVMEHMGLIDQVTHVAGWRFFFFHVTPKVTQIVREINEQENTKPEPRDIVEEVKTTVRSSRLTAWAIIGFIVFAALVTAVNQILQILKTVGVFKTD